MTVLCFFFNHGEVIYIYDNLRFAYICSVYSRAVVSLFSIPEHTSHVDPSSQRELLLPISGSANASTYTHPAVTSFTGICGSQELLHIHIYFTFALFDIRNDCRSFDVIAC